MAGTRSSTRQGKNANSNSSEATAAISSNRRAGSKRKADSAPGSKAKRGKKGNEKEQKTIEETMPDKDEEEAVKDVKMGEVAKPEKAFEEAEASTDDAKNENDTPAEEQQTTKNGDSSKMDSTGQLEPEDTTQNEDEEPTGAEGNAVEESAQREDSTPSGILEKGIIYFFFRGRVGLDEPSDINEVARSYIVLRPLPHGAKLGDGPIGDAGNNRLLALPKKVLPSSAKDRFMIFVEKANCSMEDIKTTFASADYETKTAGTRHTPAAAPIGEGVYAITTTGRESHLAYILTIPSEISPVQEDVGLRERGSFVTSVKNPSYEGPANTNLPKGPNYPQDVLDEFRSLRWMPLQPKLLDFENTQFIIIGEGVDSIDKATEQSSKDGEQDKDTPLEEMEKLEREDEIRVEHLKGNDSVFEDLGLSKKEFPTLQTTW